MQQLTACLFDLDGVIVDTAKYHFIAWRKLANALGFDFTEHDNEELKGVSRKESLEIILKMGNVSMTEQEKQVWMQRKNEWYLEYIDQMSPEEIMPGAKEFLIKLRNASIKIGLGSASKNAELILTKIGLLPLFDVIIDGNKATEPKPNPQVFLMGAEALKVAPANTIVFEDALKGVEAAIAGGFYCIGIGLPNMLINANFVVSSLADLDIENGKIIRVA